MGGRGLGFGVLGFGFWVRGLGFRVWGLGFGFRFGVRGSGLGFIGAGGRIPWKEKRKREEYWIHAILHRV